MEESFVKGEFKKYLLLSTALNNMFLQDLLPQISHNFIEAIKRKYKNWFSLYYKYLHKLNNISTTTCRKFFYVDTNIPVFKKYNTKKWLGGVFRFDKIGEVSIIFLSDSNNQLILCLNISNDYFNSNISYTKKDFINNYKLYFNGLPDYIHAEIDNSNLEVQSLEAFINDF